MPEGDVVFRTAGRLDAALSGRVLDRSDLRWPALATLDLRGRAVTQVLAVGKHLLIRIQGSERGGGLSLHSHLRMEGSWHVFATGGHWKARRSEHGIRAVLANPDWTAIGHRLGMLDLVPIADEHQLVGHLGPDLLGPGWDPELALANLVADGDRPVGEALLDQRVLAGVGTFFMSEALFLRGRSPWTPVRDAGDPAALIDLLHRLLRFSVAGSRVEQVTTGDARPGRRQYVHGRSGLECRRCGTAIRVAMIGTPPTDRTAFWCPSCQVGPAPTDDGRPQQPLGASRRPAPDRSTPDRGRRGLSERNYRR